MAKLLSLPVLMVFFVGFGVGLGGCAWKGGPHATREAERADHWVPRPVTLRFAVPPRSERTGGQGILALRMELLDEANDPIKGAGQWSFVLYGVDAHQQPTGAALYSWQIDMRTLAQNRERYDNVTGTYNFELMYEELPPLAGGGMLVAALRPASGPQLRAQAPVAVR